jgi:rRNA maturation endonuclease Nob1
MEDFAILIAVFLMGYLIGLIHSHFENRVQCVNCGRYNTYLSGAGYGCEEGVCKYAVKHWEGHICKDCGKITSVKMTLSK